jgi:iron complex outermembrane recepter protein
MRRQIFFTVIALVASWIPSTAPVWASESMGRTCPTLETAPVPAASRMCAGASDDVILRIVDGSQPQRGIPQVTVTVTRLSPPASPEPVDWVRRTGLDGTVTLSGLPVGRYQIRLEATGYEPSEAELEVPSLATMEIRLYPRPFSLDALLATATPLASGIAYTATLTLNRDELTRRLDPSIGSMLDGQPGVAMRSLGVATTRPVIRGFDGDRILVLENGERMGDVGESSADHAVALDPLVVERVDVIRGPASLLYGSGALGGVVNLMTRDLPGTWTRGWEGGVLMQGASMNQAGAGSAFLLYGAQDWATTFRLSLREAGDLGTPAGRIPDTGLSSREGALGWVRDHGGVRLGLSASFVDRAYGIPEAWDDPDEEILIAMERQAVQGRLDWVPAQPGWIRGLEVRTLAARFFQQEIEREIEPDGTVDEEVELEYDAVSLSTTAMLRHGSLIGGYGQGAVGVALRGRQMDIGGAEAFTPGSRERSAAVFTFQEAPLSDVLTLQMGARVERNWNDARRNEAFPDARQRRNATALSGSVGLNWQTGTGWEAGMQFARAHRVPLAEELYANGVHIGAGAFEIGSPDLADEVSHGTDLFLRRDLARGSLEWAVFANWIEDYIAFQPLGRMDEASQLPVFQYQGTDARMVGGEVTGTLDLSDVWAIRTGVDWVRGERRDGTREPLPTIPPVRLHLELRADTEPWGWGMTFRAASAQRRVAPEEAETRGYILVGTQVGARFGPMGQHGIILRVDNALNTRYRDHLSRMPERDFLAPGRNVSLSYRWQF